MALNNPARVNSGVLTRGKGRQARDGIMGKIQPVAAGFEHGRGHQPRNHKKTLGAGDNKKMDLLPSLL